MPKFIVKINTPTIDSIIEDNMIGCWLISTDLPTDLIKKLAQRANELEKIILFEGVNAPQIMKEFGGDGIVADLSSCEKIKKEISFLRQAIGNAFLGVISRNRRHEAMVVSENEPDFIIFRVWAQGSEQTIELSQWYSQLFLIQQAVELADDLVNFNDYPADIVILSPENYKILVAKK